MQDHLGANRLYWNLGISLMRNEGADQDDHTTGVTESLKPGDIDKILLAQTGSRKVGGLKIPANYTAQQIKTFKDEYIRKRDAKIASFQAARDRFDLKTPKIDGVSQILRSALDPTARDLKVAYKNATKFREKEEAARQQVWHWRKEEEKLKAKLSRAKKKPETPHKLLPIEPIVHADPQEYGNGKSRAARARERARQTRVPWKRQQSGGKNKGKDRLELQNRLQAQIDEAQANQVILGEGGVVPSKPVDGEFQSVCPQTCLTTRVTDPTNIFSPTFSLSS